jgi:hypothetical protein
MVEERLKMLEENVVMVINQQRQWVQQQKEPFRPSIAKENFAIIDKRRNS